jgi:hypothetical protein
MTSIRQYDFVTSIESSVEPTAGIPVADDDFVTKAWAEANLGGGGGGSLVWTSTEGKAPIRTEEYGFEVDLFGDDLDQELTTYVRVPSNYVGGIQILMKIAVYSPSAADNILLRATSSLVRQDTDAVSSTTNQHTSTNTELTNSLANEYQEMTLDLTDADGEINSIDVAAGNIIRVQLYRDTANESSPDSADVRFIRSATELKFTS